ncbi:MAG: bifunctional riboflavin kinase/FAD synthetase [SAR202 cluster bacterium]|nr:bifunctional riboflavin kinase/FAD synthetase [SAR202 cluster bacterium]
MSFLGRLASAAPDRPTVLTIGVFDGVHRGHRHLLQKLAEKARPDCIPGVVTFTNHPITVLRPDYQLNYITPLEDKVRLLREQGMELVVALDFTPELAGMSARDFTGALVEHLRLSGLVVGPDFALGRGREGDAACLTKLGAEMGFWVETVPPMLLDGQSVRSRRVREAVRQGDVALAAGLLGRWFSLRGQVVSGDRRGRELGFPTANLAIPSQMLLPADGIYATWATVDGLRHPAATSIGVRPTFGPSRRLVEVYILDFNANIYGREVAVEFVSKLRDQATFSSAAALVEQINGDVANARVALASASGADSP